MDQNFTVQKLVLNQEVLEHMLGKIKDCKVQEEFTMYEQFIADSDLNNGTLGVFILAVDSPNVHLLIEKFDLLFVSLKSKYRLNGAVGPAPKKMKDCVCNQKHVPEKSH